MTELNLDSRFMEFRLGDQLYAVTLLNVKEVIQKPDVTAVPNTSPDFEGMMNLRGQILGILNISKKLGMKSGTPTQSVVMVIEQQNVSVGMIVDEVTRVLYADETKIQAAPLKKDDANHKYISGIIKSEENLVLILDLNQLLELHKYKTHKAS